MLMKSKGPGGRAATGLRLVAGAVVLFLPAGLWFGGAQPFAAGLIPSPWDKLAHMAVFAMLAFAIALASGLRGGRMWLLALAGALLVGMVDEWHQIRLPGRNAGWDDLAADALGAVLGAWAVRWAPSSRRVPEGQAGPGA